MSVNRINITIGWTAITKADDGEEELESALFIKLISNNRRNLRTVVNGMTQTVIIRSLGNTVGHTRILHAGIQVRLDPNTDLVIDDSFEKVTTIRRHFPWALAHTQTLNSRRTSGFTFHGALRTSIFITTAETQTHVHTVIQPPT